ncbi:hypothetical protein SASPL_113362 [Salvia splendens]|uniref:NADP-dependent oxidoreductase domain-containing protein n=1 Tax=Salvia splendens TaxID=180675 RepID=A0A8X8Y1S2_SALSN|nr:hypothetical protein SASPL_113362 [Salvia splendens]
MVKFLKPNKAVVVLQGRYAGRKAVIVRSFDDGTRDRPYGHCLVVGLTKYPRKVIRKDSAKKQAKKSRVKCFIKLVNYNHIMPTRYTLDVDLKDVVTADCLLSKDKKVTAAKETKARFEERFKTGKNRWFFTKLRYARIELSLNINVPKIKLGSQGFEVSKQGLGCMGMSAFYGLPKPDADMIKLIHHAIDSGVTFLDTSDFYGPHTNEILIGKALKGGVREKVQLATKFGVMYRDGKREVRGDPAYVRSSCESSLKRLDVDCIDLYYVHRIDTMPLVVSFPVNIWRRKLGSMLMGELKKLVEEGKIKYIGLSEASASTIRRAHAVHPITSLQIEWSLFSRDVEEELIPTCRELGIGIVPYSPLGRGFLSVGPKLLDEASEGDFRKSYFPRFQGENLESNKIIYEKICEMATSKGCSPSQLALAWVHHQGDDVVPIPGTTKIDNFNDNVGALSVKLTPEEMSLLSSLAENVKGDRYITMASTWTNADTPPLESWKAEG